jgi:hypothetical protein
MVRRGVVVVAALVLAGIGLAVVTWARGPGTIYTVAQVADGLRRHPRAWVGRTVLVRGTFTAVAYGSLTSASGYGQGAWGVGGNGMLGLPTHQALHIFLAGSTPRGIPAYERKVAALLAARAPQLAALSAAPPIRAAPGHARGAPPSLVVRVRPHRVPPAWARLSQIAQQAASTLPDGSWTTLAQLPLVGPFLGQLLMPGMVHGGTPRLYRVRLLPPVPAARRAGCPLVCDDAVLLDNLS